MNLDFSSLAPAQRYFAMVQAIIPRPIAWVLSDSGEQRFNIAPYSFFTGVCSDPPILMLSAGKKPSGDEAGRYKDTRVNIEARDDFVVHIASTDLLQPLNDSAATLNHAESELSLMNLELTEFKNFRLPRVSACHIALACTKHRIDEIGNTPQAIIYGEIQHMYVSDHLIDSSRSDRLVIDPVKLDPLARLGGNFYSGISDTLTAKRPD